MIPEHPWGGEFGGYIFWNCVPTFFVCGKFQVSKIILTDFSMGGLFIYTTFYI